jgi:hypothetical protein
MTVLRRAGLTAAALALLAAAAARGPAGLAAPPRPSILAVRSDLVADTVTITGARFGTDAPPVALGGVPLVVISSSDDQIVAELPAGSSGANHRLVVGQGNRADSADVWIPGEGILTRGPIRIESTDSDVNVVAGGSRITISSNGRIQVAGAAAIEVTAGAALDLRGGTSATLRGTGAANLTSSGTTTVTGSLVRIN